MTNNINRTVTFNQQRLSIEDVCAIAKGNAKIELDATESYRNSIARGNEFLERLLKEDGAIYGVTTGYGDSCTVDIPADLVEQLPNHLYTFHGCGMGKVLSSEDGRAVLAARFASLSKGYSGVSVELLQQLTLLLQKDIVPIIPEEGSVGASGDLTPLSYVAAVLCGEREVWYRGERRQTREVFAELNISPHRLRPKEGLALMNGTAVMTALACQAFERTAYLAKLATRITSLMVIGSHGNAHHFDEILFNVKPHPGQQRVAARLREDLHAGEPPRNPSRLQDRYSLRCAPHVIGVIEDSLDWWRSMIENELNSANDNPIIDADGEHVLHGGHFYGGHIAAVMDNMKTAVANISDLLDRQLAQIVDTKFNHGLPANLSGAKGDRAAINHGFKAVQIGASAWTAEALKHTMPASVFSRSTECHNQDKVSMGTIAARDCLRVLQLTEQVTAAALLAACQGVEQRLEMTGGESLSGGLFETYTALRALSPTLEEDRALESELRQLVEAIQQQQVPVYER